MAAASCPALWALYFELMCEWAICCVTAMPFSEVGSLVRWTQRFRADPMLPKPINKIVVVTTPVF